MSLVATVETIADLNIRMLTPSDLPKMAEGAKQFYASSKFLSGFNLERFCDSWTKLIDSGLGVIIGLVDGREVCGAIAAIAHPDINSGELQCSEMFWYVLPEYRGKGLRLLLSLEKWAMEKGCKVIRMVHLSDSMPEKVAHLYERMGYEKVETHYTRSL